MICVAHSLSAMFPGANPAGKAAAKAKAEPVAPETSDWIQEIRLDMHPITASMKMYATSGGSLFRNGIDPMTFSELCSKFMDAKHVESRNRPLNGISEASATFDSSIPFLQNFLDNEILGPGMEQMMKLLQKKQAAFAALISLSVSAESSVDEIVPAVKRPHVHVRNACARRDCPRADHVLVSAGSDALYSAQELAEWTSAAEDLSQYVKAGCVFMVFH